MALSGRRVRNGDGLVEAWPARLLEKALTSAQCADEDHLQHRVYLLCEAAADCKGELSSSLNKLKQKLNIIDKVSLNNQHISKYNQAVAGLAEEQIKKDFAQLHQWLQKEEENKLHLLKQDKDKKMKELHEQMELRQEMVMSLEERIRLTEGELRTGGDGVQFLMDYKVPSKIQCADEKKPKMNFLINVAKYLGNLKFSIWHKMKQSALYSPVTLDPRTAGQNLTLPFPLITAHFSPAAKEPKPPCVPDHPEGFQPQSSVLSREGFSSGLHCWDIQVGNCNNWTVGVASQDIERRVQSEACPETGLWCISLRDGRLSALTTPPHALPYSSSCPLEKIHVTLDWDSGSLEFHNAGTDTRIFTFTHRFTETVYPYFETTSNTGDLSVVPREVSVSVALEGEIAEDLVSENCEIVSSQTVIQGKSKKTKKRILKPGLVKTQPAKTAQKVQLCEEYHVSLFRLQKSNDSCNQIKHG
uniref:B30.2/SPRY domain-containing protein n=1 Tax=Knipowitschia caucasica TaxID=637954 RepID=A0AAV2LIC1_KNICA